MTHLFYGCIGAERKVIKHRRLFDDVEMVVVSAPCILPAESSAEANAMAYMEVVQRYPRAEGWDNHIADMYEVPKELVRIVAQGMG